MTSPVIRTVLGPVAEADWPTATLTHVHLLGGPVESPLDGTDAVADLHLLDEALALEELRLLRAAGCRAVVEMSVLDFQRDLAGLARLSERSGVHVVAASGFRRGGTATAAGWSDDWGQIADRLRHDATVGEDGVRVGVLKAGSGHGQLTGMDRATLRAAAVVAQETGLPISTHSDAGELVVDQVRELERWGADLGKVAVGHIDRVLDRDVHRGVLETGASVIYDQIGKDKYAGVEDYVELLCWLADSGFADRVMLSSDFGRRSYLQAFGGTPGLAYVMTGFRTGALAGGVPPELLDQALGANVWRFYSHPEREAPRDVRSGVGSGETSTLMRGEAG